jgi:phenylpropionate dioxygenase-like ring-hydroxylating dioxygenase large terminal subunit
MIYIILLFIPYIYGYGWLPLLDLKTYNTKKPSEINILDKKLVIWEKDNEIVVQDNFCMHRGGPLSEGYIDRETKNLRCSYHGWEFNNYGQVESIPQAYNDCNKCRFLVQNTYRTKKSCNMLWINLNESICEFPSHISNKNGLISNDIFVAEVPYTMNILLENLFDPAHVPFAHHKLQSFRDLASSVNSTVLTMNSTSLEIYFEDKTLKDGNYRNGTMSFYNPGHYVLSNIYPKTFIKQLHVYCVPILPHKTRIFVQYEYDDGWFKEIYSKIPSWFKHSLTHAFFDSDTMILYKQEQALRSKNILKDCTSIYTTPTSSDYSIKSFHKWKKSFPQIWSDLVNENNSTFELSRMQVFDRYNDHTKNCKHCSDALNNLKNMQKILPTLLLIHSIYNNNIYEVTIAISIYYLIENMKSFFIYRDYIHNEL